MLEMRGITMPVIRPIHTVELCIGICKEILRPEWRPTCAAVVKRFKSMKPMAVAGIEKNRDWMISRTTSDPF